MEITLFDDEVTEVNDATCYSIVPTVTLLREVQT